MLVFFLLKKVFVTCQATDSLRRLSRIIVISQDSTPWFIGQSPFASAFAADTGFHSSRQR